MKTLKLPGYIRLNGSIGLGPADPSIFKLISLRAMRETDYRKMVKALKRSEKYERMYDQAIHNCT